MKKEYFCIGRVVGSRGINGEIKIEPWCDSPEDFHDIQSLYFDVEDKPIDVVNIRVHKSQVLVKIKDINDKNSAEKFRGKYVYAYKKDIPLEEGRYFIEELKGCTVFDFKSKKLLGKLKDVFNTGANDIYVVESSEKKEYLVPIIDGTVEDIDIELQKILINPIRGIFDE